MPPGWSVFALAIVAMSGLSSVPARSEKIQITIDQLAFSPAVAKAKVGDTIEWDNKDMLAHTATARNGEWDVTIPANASATSTITKPGIVDYYCRFHPDMTGRIIAEPQ